MVFGCLGVKDSKKRRSRWRCVIAVDFQTMVRLKWLEGYGGLHFDASILLL